MRFILSKFRKTKPSVKDTLDKIEKDLGKLARFQIDTEVQQKRIIGRLVVGASFLYVLVLLAIYVFGPRDLSLRETVGWVTPLILFPFLIIGVKRLLALYYDNKIVKNKRKYEDLKKEKQRLLDDVMENETFKVAKEILEKYAPSHLLPKYLADQQRASPGGLTPLPRGGTGLRRRMNPGMQPMPYPGMGGFSPRAIRPYGPPGSAPGQFLRQPTNTFRPAIMPAPGPPGGPGGFPPGPPPPRFMLPPPPINPQFRTRKTGWLDRVVDYVTGDGATNRFALICRYCATHNGLATPDDFPFIAYKCIYCRQFNPPRQQRPSAATLPKNVVLIEEMTSANTTPDTSINDGEAETKSENKENDENSEDQETSDRGEESENKQSDDEPIVDLAASSVEDVRKSSESLTVEEQSEEDRESNDEAREEVEQADTSLEAKETGAQELNSSNPRENEM